eukprot:7382044-Prymnesium_polylepis.1
MHTPPPPCVAHRHLFVPCTGVHGPAQNAAGALAKPPGALPGGATWRAAVAARRCGRHGGAVA